MGSLGLVALPTNQAVRISGDENLINLSVEMVLDLLNELGILRKDEVNCSTLSTETTCSTNSMNVVLLLEGELVVDNKTDLLNINTSSKKISSNENTD